jgi:hypothetical protein
MLVSSNLTFGSATMNAHLNGQMSPLAIFAWGCAGSIAVEVINLYSVYQKAIIEMPERYHRPGFYVVRLPLTLLAGGLALAYDIDKPLLALNIGAATPLLIQTLAQGLVTSSGSPSASKPDLAAAGGRGNPSTSPK